MLYEIWSLGHKPFEMMTIDEVRMCVQRKKAILFSLSSGMFF